MSSKFRLFTKRFFLYLNILLVVVFLLACIAPYLDPAKWWFISFLGLGFPFLLLAVLFSMIGWLFVKRKFAVLSAAALLLGYKSISVFFSFHHVTTFHEQKSPKSIRIASWNVARFIEMKRNNNKGSQTRLRMMEQIQESNADVICLQEFFHSIASDWYPNLTYISKHFNYPYYYFSHDDDGDKHFFGNVIFSRFPIIDSGLIRYPRPTLPESLVHVDLKVNDDTVRVYTTHLQSLQLKPSDYASIDNLKEGDVSNSRTIFSKLRTGISYRKIQVDLIRQLLGDSPYPVIFCGDLNDVPNSYTYYAIKGTMQDAFLEKGFGMGRTFLAISPTLRIDYILADDHFRIEQFKRVLKGYSDHYMLVSDIAVKSPGH